MENKRLWLFYALITTLFWGLWGAFSTIPEKMGIPGNIIYVVWSVSMIIPGLIGIILFKWKIQNNAKSVIYGLLIGLTGAGGQLVLLSRALREGPAHLIFPIISLSPVITIALSLVFLKEKSGNLGVFGIILALGSMVLLSIIPSNNTTYGNLWVLFAISIFFAWGIQAFLIKLANQFVRAESIFFYMIVSGLLLVPLAFIMGDPEKPAAITSNGLLLAFGIQTLNSLGALCLVYAFRYGKAIIVSPLTNAIAPALTVIISLIIYQTVPSVWVFTGMGIAFLSTFIFAISDTT